MSTDVLAIIDEALGLLQPYGIPITNNARAMLYAIAGQEAGWQHRFQISKRADGTSYRGPARGLWQFELGGGVRGVLEHEASNTIAYRVATGFVGDFAYGGYTGETAVWAVLPYEDVLAAAFARLLLWTDRRKLPDPSQANAEVAWGIYNSVWRPGKPHKAKWAANWLAAVKVVEKGAC